MKSRSLHLPLLFSPLRATFPGGSVAIDQRDQSSHCLLIAPLARSFAGPLAKLSGEWRLRSFRAAAVSSQAQRNLAECAALMNFNQDVNGALPPGARGGAVCESSKTPGLPGRVHYARLRGTEARGLADSSSRITADGLIAPSAGGRFRKKSRARFAPLRGVSGGISGESFGRATRVPRAGENARGPGNEIVPRLTAL